MGISALLKLPRGYLSQLGYFKSLIFSKFYQTNEKPWWTFPCYEFLLRKDLTQLSVVEFGSGASTKFLSTRVREIISFETDKKWHANLEKFFDEKDIKNVTLKLIESCEEEKSVKNYETYLTAADIFVIDGFNRNRVCEIILENAKEAAVIIFDDFDRNEYSTSRELLISSGYKVIEFWGLSFGSSNLNCTAAFYKNNNALSL